MSKGIISNFCGYKTTLTAVTLLALCLLSLATSYAQNQAQKPDLFLLKTYDGSQDVIGWVMSEKMDGVRGIWNGKQLMSRGGNVLHAPKWFVRDFPPFALDGELWTKRADFENITSIVRRKKPDERWAQVSYNVFEVPHQAGGLLDRLAVLGAYLQQHPSNHLKIIPQTKVGSKSQLQQFLALISAAGGEGAVVRNPLTPYQTGRLSSALKVKKYLDSECIVRAILPGKGKYAGKMGSISCAMTGEIAGVIESGHVLKIGSGFSDAMRTQPPPIGSIITFKYYGLTAKGKPRFPVFLRIRK